MTDATTMWWGVGCALLALLIAALIPRWPSLLRVELLLPAVDFVAVGLLRYGTGESRSVFLAIVVLPVIWIAANPGRRHIAFPLVGTCVTLLLPYVIAPGVVPGSEAVRLVVALLVYAAVATVTNELARRATLRLDVAKRQRRVMEAEIVQAALMQQALLPNDTTVLPAQLDAVGVCLPAKRVGGDFYDWFPTKTGAAFTLGDVMGKGVAAGMIAAAVRSVIRSTVDDADAAHGLRRAAAGIATGGGDILSGQFTTCFHLRVDRDGTAQWADAGHGLTILRRADGTREALRSADLPLGIGSSWTSVTTTLADGDAIVTFSDGVLDLFGTDADTFDRFAAFLDEHTTAAATVDAVAALAKASDHPDDVTILAVTYRAAALSNER
ncbi:PP2C family protein-serine/threonine phosphatase [Curtobacterium flaccumfaciens]|uniref:PP2C family protein-serine/threonine phosphatase n=1 Tax=Curtobacterium flaccumfaciens TaxID=2035 RepID=UPI0015FFBAF9|nr:SpoIIE family protein phosphatase [Curtobacterium flaccumfaciens]MBB1198667.1 regulator [Curtobacterium flaccumfaciens]